MDRFSNGSLAVIATVMPPSGEPVPGLRPHLVLKVKKGWRLDAATQAFVDAHGRRHEEAGRLPPGTTIVPMTPVLHQRDVKRLTSPERELVRYYQVIFPAGIDPRGYAEAVKRWPCAEEARLPPHVSLPGGSQ